MSSQCTSLRTDSEEINLSLSDPSFDLDISNYSNFPALDTFRNPFPNISFSIESSQDNSEDVRVLQRKNLEIKQVIRENITKLKEASEKIIADPNFGSFQKLIEDTRVQKDLALEAVMFSDLVTGETENNAEILQEIISNVRKLNCNLESAKNNLKTDMEDIEYLETEHENLKFQLNEIATTMCNTLSIEAQEKNISKTTCKCEIF